MTESEIAMLGADGWFSREDCANGSDAAAAQRRIDRGQLTPAGTSRAGTLNMEHRGDTTQWLSQGDADFSPLWTMFEALRVEMNEGAWLGLQRFEVQLAHYAGRGEGYARHRDAFDGPESRRLTAIVYLNVAWKHSHGGQLRLHGRSPVDIAPTLGRLVVFRSARVEHEVLASWASRLAATAWYYGS